MELMVIDPIKEAIKSIRESEGDNKGDTTEARRVKIIENIIFMIELAIKEIKEALNIKRVISIKKRNIPFTMLKDLILEAVTVRK